MSTSNTLCRAVVLLLASCLLLTEVQAGDWYVGPEGDAGNTGTRESPWDATAVLAGEQQQVQAGDTVYFLPGTYRAPRSGSDGYYHVKLQGTADAPIHLRPVPRTHVIIDGGLRTLPPAAHVWMWEFEVTSSEPRPEQPTEPSELDARRQLAVDNAEVNPIKFNGGVTLHSGEGHKAINLVVHDNLSGIDAWLPAIDAEVYGCLIYHNGWTGPGRGHGHGSYTQNHEGTKVYSNNIYTNGYGWSMHAYGSSNAYVDNYLITQNIVYNHPNYFLVGGGRPSNNIQVIDNILHHHNMRIGYNAPHNENAIVRDNVIVGGGLDIVKYNQVENENNLIIPRGNITPQLITRVLPNKYDPKRAHVVVIDVAASDAGRREGTVDASNFVGDGIGYRLMNPEDFFGEPVYQGTSRDGKITVPMEGELAVYVMLLDER